MSNNQNVPILTPEQRKIALDKALEARKVRAKVAEMLSNGELTIEELLETTDKYVKRMKIEKILRCFPGVGKARVPRIMDRLDISMNRSIAGLGERQKKALIKFVNEEVEKNQTYYEVIRNDH